MLCLGFKQPRNEVLNFIYITSEGVKKEIDVKKEIEVSNLSLCVELTSFLEDVAFLFKIFKLEALGLLLLLLLIFLFVA